MKRLTVDYSRSFSVALLISLFFSFFSPIQVQRAAADKVGVCGTPGGDGPIAGLSGVINTYYPGSANANAGTTSIPVGPARAGGGPSVEAGDLLLVVQMQGADLNSSNDERYGDGVGAAGVTGNTVVYSAANAYAGGNLPANFSAGQYEYVVAAGPVAAGFLPITSPLVNNYFNADFSTQGQRRFQVIRVPQYSNASLGGTVTALRWDGRTGGVVSFDVAGQLDWNGGTVDVSGLGFRGGGGRQLLGDAGASSDYLSASSLNMNGSKGEGYAGTPRYVNDNGALLNTGFEGYAGGSYGRGAAGNGGGGSTDGNPATNEENSGGGGGGNGGFGGMGGNSWRSALVVGGFGGSPFPGSAPRLILGGGGGAGTTNNATGTPGAGFASSGAAGGGVVMIRSNIVTGTGSINASGAMANQTVDNDGGGGGGAGGSVVVIARNGSGSVGNLTVNARGGNGGNSVAGGTRTHHGPGGGGGGGFVFTSGGVTGVSSVAGGLGGQSSGSSPLPTPQAFGATNGGTGQLVVTTTPSDIPSSISGANCVPVSPQITKTTSTPLLTQTATGTTGIYNLVVSVPTNSGWVTGLEIIDNLPGGAPGTITYASTTSISTSGAGTARTSVTDPVAGSTTPTWGTFDIAPGGSVTIIFTVNISSAVPVAVYQNPAQANFLDPQRTTATDIALVNYDAASSTQEDIQLVTTSGPTPVPPTSTPGQSNSSQKKDAPAVTVAASNFLIPVTGFAPGRVSLLREQPKALAYSAQSDLVLKIPSLRVEMPIIGVPFVDGGWDVSWLGNSAGYLAGTAFPTWDGNSVLTSHVYGADGLPGPFVGLNKLKWGDKVLVEAFGQVYTYEVRTVYTVRPYDKRPFGHKDEPWITLITCKQYDEKTDSYKLRTVVQAVLVSISEK